MTQQELREYNKLPSEGKIFYDQYMKMHPAASHGQAMTYTTIRIGIEIPKGPIDIKEIVKAAIRKAREWLRTEVPRIFEKVRSTIDNLLNRLATDVLDTWNAVKRWLSDMFE